MAFKQRVFSGVQPTGNLHLGNYLGAIKQLRRAAGELRLHLLRRRPARHHGAGQRWGGPAELRRATREVTAAFIACGIDPKKHIVFNQSQVAEHAELAWVFNCVARIGWLNRMTQFKEKAGKDRENASVGLYAYPALMAADILVLPRDARAGRRGPEAASRALPRHRAEVQQRLRRVDRARSGYGEAFFPLTEPMIQGPGDARDVAARRHQEDVEVGCVRQFAHQPDRRRRHDRAEDPPREDRSRAAAERGGGTRSRVPRPTIWSASMRRSPTRPRPRC